MAKRKSDLTSSYTSSTNNTNTETTGVQSIDKSHITDESSTLSGIIDGRYQEKTSNLNKLSGARTEITYYQQVPCGENNALVNMAGFNTSDPNLGRFLRIEDLAVKMDNIEMNFDSTEGNGPKSAESESKLVILPNTVLPNPNDRFTMKYLDRVRLYKITDVTPLSGDSESAYECTFICEDNDFNYDSSELRKQVVEDYIFDETYLGTSMRTVFREEEYDTLTELKELYSCIGKIYKRDFWDKQLETYIFTYEDNMGVEEYRSKGVYNLEMSKIEYKRAYRLKQMYDGQLIDFILKNRIFYSIEYFPTVPTQYTTQENARIYNGTIFSALERKNRKSLRNKFQMPMELNISNPDAQPVLYGKMNLIHVSTQNDSILNLYPSGMCDIIAEQVSEDMPVTQIDTSSTKDLIVYTIALFINNKTKNLSKLINAIYDKMDDLNCHYDILPTYQTFYLLPILGFIAKSLADDIVSNKTGDNILSDPISARRVESNK